MSAVLIRQICATCSAYFNSLDFIILGTYGEDYGGCPVNNFPYVIKEKLGVITALNAAYVFSLRIIIFQHIFRAH